MAIVVIVWNSGGGRRDPRGSALLISLKEQRAGIKRAESELNPGCQPRATAKGMVYYKLPGEQIRVVKSACEAIVHSYIVVPSDN
jgi:hypothetical protein